MKKLLTRPVRSRAKSTSARKRPTKQVAKSKTSSPALRATYDAASESNEDNRRHWLNVDSLSAKSANSYEVRKTLRERARYEAQNNGYAAGLILTLANDLVGTGPTLQCQLENPEWNKQIEIAFAEWAEAVGLAEKLHTLKQAKTRCGEGFALLTTNEALDAAVNLDVQLIETDRVTDADWNLGMNPMVQDGIEYDRSGNPVAYYVLDEHPGDTLTASRTFKKVPARFMVHWYRVDRPGQLRGVPEITPALPLFAQLRRYTLASLVAAEVIASMGAAVLETQMDPDTDDPPEPFETLELDRGLLTTLPAGAKLNQVRPEQPATTYDMFKRELLKEIGRPVNAPFNVVSGDSSPYNYSSARLDHILYRGAVRVERASCRRAALERIFRAWLEEAVMIPGLLPDGLTITRVLHTWYWPGFSTIDPLKEANADTVALTNYTTTLAEKYAERGEDWEDGLRQAAREHAMKKKLGLVVEVEEEPVTEETPASENDAREQFAAVNSRLDRLADAMATQKPVVISPPAPAAAPVTNNFIGGQKAEDLKEVFAAATVAGNAQLVAAVKEIKPVIRNEVHPTPVEIKVEAPNLDGFAGVIACAFASAVATVPPNVVNVHPTPVIVQAPEAKPEPKGKREITLKKDQMTGEILGAITTPMD